jgi:hypothetical protein
MALQGWTMRPRWRIWPVLVLLSSMATPARAREEGSGTAEEARGSLAATERLAKQDLARRLKVSEDELKVLSSAARTWMDSNFGCAGRKGIEEPKPVPGYEVVVGHEDRRYTYHADRQGNLRSCDRPAKPLGPISH